MKSQRALSAGFWIAAVMLTMVSITAAAPVLMISVDGLKPEYVLKADSLSIKIPYLRRLLAQGCYAEGVVGVWPTATYPAHMTIVTGVSPAEHGIFDNAEFDPLHQFKESWYWYAQQVRVPTLWAAAHAAGLRTASIGWPVTVGDSNIDYLIPEYWRLSGPAESLNASDRYLVAALSRPDGLLVQMRASSGEYLMGNDTSLHADEIKTKFAIEIIHRQQPAFMTIHLSSLDDAQHAHGAFSKEANELLETMDSLLSQLDAAAHANNSKTLIAVVSDHGFTAITHRVNLNVAFRRAGLIHETEDPDSGRSKVADWKAQAWPASGMAAIMMHDAKDQATEQVVAELLRKLAENPDNGIASIKEHSQIKPLGGFPDAAFLVVFKEGFYAGAGSVGELVKRVPGTHGGHGFSPEYPDMRSAFMIAGPGIASRRNLGVVDMRQIAPTIAQLLNVSLPTAKSAPLHLAP